MINEAGNHEYDVQIYLTHPDDVFLRRSEQRCPLLAPTGSANARR
jgi:hypothetical protein